MPFELEPLPFAQESLAPFMSRETLDFHHGRHHRAYVDKVNALVAATDLEGASLVEVVRAADAAGNQALFNNSAQMWNHNFFWKCLAPPGSRQPDGRLATMIEAAFGSSDALLAGLRDEAAGHFSNGWAWLVLEREALKIVSLHDADTPLVHDGMTPLLVLDVWEHAYYIDYRNARPKFAEQVLGNLVNWSFVADNLDGEGAQRADQRPAKAA